MKCFLGVVACLGIGISGCVKQMPEPSRSDTAVTMEETAMSSEFSMDTEIKPPVAERRPHTVEMHGVPLDDDYNWLQDDARTDADVLAYLEAENEYTNALLEPLAVLQRRLYGEIVSTLKRSSPFIPFKRGDYFVYNRVQPDKPYPILCRRYQSVDAEDEIVLDVNELAKGHRFCRVYPARYSPDMRYLAYVMDTVGNERGTLYFKDLNTGLLLDERIGAVRQMEWANDSKTMFYTINDDEKNVQTLKRHVLGEDPESDAVICQETDVDRWISLEKFNSGQYIAYDVGNHMIDEWYVIDANQPTDEPICVQAALPDLQYWIAGHRGDRFYIITNNDSAKDRKIVSAPVDRPGIDNWKEFYPEQDASCIEDMLVFRDYAVIIPRHGGVVKPVVIHLDTGESHVMVFPEPVYAFHAGRRENDNFDTPLLRCVYTSMVTPSFMFDYDMQTQEWTEIYRDDPPEGYDPHEYITERIYASTDDGTQIPISLVYKKALFRGDGSNPLLMEAYGSYGVSMDVFFLPFRLSLLDRGFVYAVAHVRGGGEYGWEWREQGTGRNKKNGITDFIQCCEHLVAEGYTNPKRLAITGGSAGGIIIGAAVNMRPDLFEVVIANVPFVDLLNTLMDSDSLKSQNVHALFGDLNDPASFEYVRSYCPYQNVAARNYPHMYIRNGFQDARVKYWQPAKWAAKLRHWNTGDSDIVLDTGMEAGHFGPSNRFNFFDQMAKEWAFMMDRLGIEN